MLRKDGLDILVELSGHTDGHRLAVLARRVAPIQVTYLGYPNTTGLAAIDYRITDRVPIHRVNRTSCMSRSWCDCPKTFLCYSPPETGGDSRMAPFRRNGYVTFCSFNNFRKISPTCVTLWGRGPFPCPKSKLLIKTYGLRDPGLRARLLEQLDHAGIESDRISVRRPDTQPP